MKVGVVCVTNGEGMAGVRITKAICLRLHQLGGNGAWEFCYGF